MKVDPLLARAIEEIDKKVRPYGVEFDVNWIRILYKMEEANIIDWRFRTELFERRRGDEK